MSAEKSPCNPRFMFAAKHVRGSGIYIYPISANSANMVLPAAFTTETLMFPMFADRRISANSANSANSPVVSSRR